MVTLRIYIFAFLLISLSAGNVFAQSVESQIKSIRKELQAINSDKTFKTVVLENEEFLKNMTDGGGTLTGYIKNGEIRKIVSWVGLSYGNRIKEWYFKDGKLIFASEVFNAFHYNKRKARYDYNKTKKLWEVLYYFNDKKLIDYSITGPVFFEADEVEPSRMLHEEVAELLKLIETKNKYHFKKKKYAK